MYLEKCFVWSIYLYFWYFAFLDLQISAILQVKDGDWEDHSFRTTVCMMLALLVLILTVSTPFVVYFLVYRYRTQLYDSMDNPVKQRFGALTSGLRSDVAWAKYLVPVYYLQRLLYSLLIVYMRNRPFYQSIVLIIPCGLMAVFTLITRPMCVRSTRVLHIIAEIDALMVYILLCFATLNYDTPRVDICWVIVAFTLKSFLCTFLIVIIHAIIGIKDALQRRKQAKDLGKIDVETLENTNSKLSIQQYGDVYPSSAQITRKSDLFSRKAVLGRIKTTELKGEKAHSVSR